MPRRVTQPPDTVDTLTTRGDTIVGGRPGEGVMYRDTTSWGQPRPGVPGYDPPEPAVPSEPALPMLTVARATVGRHLGLLREQAAGLERDISRGVIGMHGQLVPHLVERQQAAREALEAIHAEIERIEAMDELAVRQLAYSLGAR
jgi:hypothetical protein